MQVLASCNAGRAGDLRDPVPLDARLRRRSFFGAHVVAVDDASGAVIGATLSGWRCTAPGPAQFDGTYEIAHLPVGRSYQVYAEPLDNTVYPSLVSPAIASLCRNATTDAGWPPLQACVIPAVNASFTTRTRPAS
jgi:hypothetical protein